MRNRKITYTKGKYGTTLSTKFGYKGELRLGVSSKKDIQERLDTMNNDELKDYLKKVEGLDLNLSYSFNGDDRKLWRRGGFKINKRNLTLRLNVSTPKRVLQEKMFDLDALDSFIAKGEYPKNDS